MGAWIVSAWHLKRFPLFDLDDFLKVLRHPAVDGDIVLMVDKPVYLITGRRSQMPYLSELDRAGAATLG